MIAETGNQHERNVVAELKASVPNLLEIRNKDFDAAKGFFRLPWRWVVERTFGWLVKARRLERDYERNPRDHEALVYIQA